MMALVASVFATFLLLAAPATHPATRAVDPMANEAAAAARERRLPAFALGLEAQLRTKLEDPTKADLDEVIRLAMFRQHARFFARVTEPGEGSIETIAWLAEQPRFAMALMLATSPFDPPDRVLEIVRALRQDYRGKTEEFADLAAAVCVVWDEPERFGAEEGVPVDLAEVSRIFGYFAAGAQRMRIDPRKLPCVLLVYVVDGNLIEPEQHWAAERYGVGGVGAGADIAAAFFAVPYHDYPAYDRGRKGEDDRAYVLPNILRRGGNGADAAYFASNLAKLAGVPSAIIRGAAANDTARPAWVAFLDVGNRAFDLARHRDHAGWPGEAVDPQTGQALAEADVAMLAGLMTTSSRDRLASLALLQSSDLVAKEQRVALFRRAIDLSSAHRAAWWALADHAATEKFDAEQMKPIEELIGKHLKRSPEFALSLRVRMLKGRGSIEHAAGLKQAAERVAGRPDLLAQIGLAIADRQMEDKQYVDATRVLIDVLKEHATGPIALAVMIRLDDALRKQEDVPRLARVYAEVFAALPKPAASKLGRTTAYYQIGEKYAAALDEVDDSQAAAQVRVKINAIALPAQ
ncbi:MAG: hypothetical protein ABIP55_11960 [Tepidisphaeraceae bacterium]